MCYMKKLGCILIQLSTPSLQINIVNIGTVATEIQSAIADNVLATSVMATLLVPDGMQVSISNLLMGVTKHLGAQST